MKIKVLGSGCPNCQRLYDLVVKVKEDIGIDAEVEYITNIEKLIEIGLTQSPAVSIDDSIVCQGRVPGEEELKELLQNPQSK